MNSTMIITLVLGIIGLVLFLTTIRGVLQARASKDWPSVTGTVVMSRIDYRRSSDGDRSAYPVVVYEYEVMGNRYQSQRIKFGTQVGGSLVAPRVVKKYPMGSPVTVYYNPNNPSDAVLSRSSSAGSILFIFLLVAVVIVGIQLFIRGQMNFSF